MNRLILTALLLAFLGTSCIPRNAKDKEADAIVETDGKAKPKKDPAKPRYKADIKEELQDYFVHQASGKVEQVIPKHVTSNVHGTYIYFFLRNKKGVSLKLHVQYDEYDADVFEFVADGETMQYEANKSYQFENENVVQNTSVRWYDNAINLADEEFFRKIQDAESVTLNMKLKEGDKLIGSIKLTPREVESLVETIDYYKAWDGATIPKKGMVNIRSY